VATAAVAFAAVLVLWRRGGGGFDTAWLPSWNARLAFRLDGLGALYAALATGIGSPPSPTPAPTCPGTWSTRGGRRPRAGASTP
jgi:hypothetical protein